MSFLKDYYKEIGRLLDPTLFEFDLIKVKDIILNSSKSGGTIYVLGNGGSSATASHLTVDLTKNAKIRAVNFNEADLITCLSNDFSFSDWMAEALSMYSQSPNDLVIFISCSGMSPNVINGARWAIKNNRKVITLSGNSKENNLIKENKDGINLWVNSKSFNIIEIIHHAWVLSIVDLIIGKAEYPATPHEYKK